LHQAAAEGAQVLVQVEDSVTRATPAEVKVALRDLLEIAVPLRTIQAAPGVPLRFQISLWQGGLPLGMLPQEGALQLSTAEPVEWTG
jgi:hypothetical protein